MNRFIAATALSVLFSGQASAQCAGRWILSDGFAGTTLTVDACARWRPDAGNPACELVVVGGNLSAAGNIVVNNIAAFDAVADQ